MKMMKRFTSILLVLCMVLSLVPAITLGASAADGTYTLVTSASDLAVGDKIVIAAKDYNVALSTEQKSNNRGAATVTKSDNTLTIGADVQILTLAKGTVDGTYAFNTGSGYLYAPGNVTSAGNNQNYLKTTDTVDAQGSWLISVSTDGTASIVAQGTNTSCTMQYNKSNNGLFACYSSASQQAIAIYKLSSDAGSTDPEPSCDHSNTTLEGVVAATCIATGYSGDKVCVDCGETVTPGAVTDKIAHNYVSGTCSMCGAAEPGDYSGRYYIATVRSSGNYFYMTNDLGTATDKRYQAVDSGLTTPPDTITNAEANKIFVLVKNADGTYKIYAEGITADAKYLGWNSDNTGILVASDSAINATVALTSEGLYNIHFAASDAERYLSLNNSSDNNYFAWYKGTQKQNLSLIPVTESTSCTHSYANGYCTVCGAADPNSSTPGMIRASIKIITGSGKAWFEDSDGNKYALTDDSGNALGSEATEKAKVYRALVPIDGRITLVLQPDADQRLACIEQNSSRLGTDQYSYDSTGQYITFPFIAKDDEKHTGVNNYFRITFLPRLADGGYTAVQATETGTTITPGIYVMTGVLTPETYTDNKHLVDTTYLLYADSYTVVDDGNIAVGRKSSALQLSSVGVFLDTEDPYLMTAVNKNHLVNIQPSGDHYTIGLVGAEGYYLKSIADNDLAATNNVSEDGTLWDITYLSDGAYKITNVSTGRNLLFNSEEKNLQFRAYLSTSSVTLAGNAPVLYRAAKVSQLVTYTVTSATGTGSIYANNNSTASAVASGTYQTIDSQLTFTFTPAYGYQLDSVTVNGETVTLTDGTYTCTVVEGTDIHVEVSYSEIPANRNITVNYYVNGVLQQTVTTLASHVYTLDIDSLNPVTVNGVKYTYSELSFTRAENGTAVYSSLQAAIPVKAGDVINAYFSTTAVNLNKTARETTDRDKYPTVNDANGGLNDENFTDSNDTDSNCNVMQTFEITLKAQSSSKGQDIIEGNTDVIVVLDNSNSMHKKELLGIASGFLAGNPSGNGFTAVSDPNNAIWNFRTGSSSNYATITMYNSPYYEIAFDPVNKVFGAYPQGHSMEPVVLIGYYQGDSMNSAGWYRLTSLSDLSVFDVVTLRNADGTYYMNASVQDRYGRHLAEPTNAGIDTDNCFYAITDNSKTVLAFGHNNINIQGESTNSEYTLAALKQFYDVVFDVPGNRVGIVKFNSAGYVWNGSEFLAYNGNRYPNYYSIAYETSFMDNANDAMDVSELAIGTKENENGGTNFVGAWLMTQVLALTRDFDTERELVIVFFTDGQPTMSYAYTANINTEENTYTESWSDDYSDWHHFLDENGNIAELGGGMCTSAGEYFFAMERAQDVKQLIEDYYATGVSIHNIALLNDPSQDKELVDMLMSNEASVTKQWNAGLYSDGSYRPYDPLEHEYKTITDASGSYTYNWYTYGNVENFKSGDYFRAIDPYADSYAPVVGDVSNSLNDAFNAIAVTITPGKVVEGTIEDTIPAGFELTDDSRDALEDAGWTIIDNDEDGTTTLVSPTVKADEDGETFTYEIQYQGNGYGAEYTNVEAKYIYEGVDEENEYVSYFPMPVVEVIPWTVNDGYTADTNVAVTLDVMKNDLFEELTAGGYIVSNLTVTLTDANGTPTAYMGAQAGGFDAVVDPASNTVSFVTEVGGTHTFYYVVSAKVTAPDGTVTTVYSRATRVDVLTVSVETVSDVDVIAVGETGSANILANDTYASGTNDAGNNVVLTDANGNELTSSTIGILTGVSVVKETGVLTYTAAESGVQQFWYVNTVTVTDSNGNTVTVSTPPTKVTILVLDNVALVVDYGYTTQPLQAHPDLGSYTVADGVTLASVVAVTYPVNVNGTYGTANFNNGAFTFTPATTMFGGLDIFNYTVKITENTYNVRTATYEPTVTVVPANSVHYEESFLNYATTGVDLTGKDLTTWSESDEGPADTRDQSTANKLYGYDSVYALIESYSGNSAKVATVTAKNPTAVAYFNFTGTGFDLYGLSSQDTGFLLAEIYTYDANAENNLGTIKQYVMVDTYIQGKTYEQLPILCYRDLPYGSYAVKLRVVYEKAFDHNLTSEDKATVLRNEDYYRRILGLQEGIEMEILTADFTSAPATRVATAAKGSYSIVLDGIRIYQPLGATPEDPTAAQLYEAAGETGLSFFRIRDLLLSYGKWADTTNTVSGLVYIAASDLNGGISDKPEVDESESVYLTPTQSFVLEEVVDKETGKTYHYLIDAETGDRATYVDETDGKAYEIYVTVVETVDDNGKPGWANEFRYEKDGEEIVISADWVQEQGFMRLKNYYEAIGPKYELYLTNGNGIAFTATADQLLHLSMKVPEGERATLQAYVNGQWVDAATVTSRTEMYYDLSGFVNSDGSVIIRCSAAEGTVLSLCNIKTASDITVTQRSIRLAAAAFEGPVVENGDGFKMGHSVSFESDLKMNYRIKYSALAELVPNYVAEGAYLVVEKDRYFANGETAVETVTLTADLSSDPDRMIFVLDGIQSVEMGSELRATLHFFDAEGREHTSPVDTYSVLAYAKECFQNSTDTRLYTMVIDLLNYGAAAQRYFNRNAANPVNAGLDAYQKYASTALSAELSDEMTVAGGTATAVSKIGFAVNFADRTEIKVKLSLAEGYTAEDITSVKVLDESGNVVEVLTDLAEIEDGKLEATFSGVTSVCMRRMYYFVAYSADQAVSETVGFSVEAYAKGAMDSAGESFNELLTCCIYYGDAAEAYFKD